MAQLTLVIEGMPDGIGDVDDYIDNICKNHEVTIVSRRYTELNLVIKKCDDREEEQEVTQNV